MYSIVGVCEVYTDDMNMGVGGLGLEVCLLIGFVVLVRQGLGVQVKGLGIPLFVWSREFYSSDEQQCRNVQIQ